MSLNPFLIKVAVPLPVDGLFTYSVPRQLSGSIKIGLRVIVPFGKRIITAFVVETSSAMPDYKVKAVQEVLDGVPLFQEDMVCFFNWIANYYIYPVGEVIKHALPKGLEIQDRVGLRLTKDGRKALEKGSLSKKDQQLLTQFNIAPFGKYSFPSRRGKLPPIGTINRLVQKGWLDKTRRLCSQKVKARKVQKISMVPTAIENIDSLSIARQKIMTYLQTNSPVNLSELRSLGSNAVALAHKMHKDDQVKILQERALRDPFGETIDPDHPPRLTPEQLVAMAQIKSTLLNKYQTYLLSGVTGSGKTEIYLQLTELTISRGFSALILVPEIALISQMERRFRARFGDQVAVLHSSLTQGQRYDQWELLSTGKISICIGVRSAIFAPVNKIGLIVVDEEHDSSYKQEDRLRYNARDLAVVRGKQNQATVVLGSATPSIQSYHNVIAGKFVEIPLHYRVKKRRLPEIEIVDLEKDKELTGKRRFITPKLYHAIQTSLARGEQTLLFLNRRGFANLPICKNCGEALKCKNCDISLTLHKSINGFKCHLCGYSRAATSSCPHCNSSKFLYLGMGTEKIETSVKQLFPEAKVARMDRDTTAPKGALLKILKDLRNGAIDILIGTQMVAKGHDFPNITLVGIICADLSLSFPDFRAGERTFQLLAQVAGRTGRGDTPGRVILQSYQTDHFSITAAQSQNFRKFYAQEIAFRKALNYPPFSRMIQIRITSRDKNRAKAHAHMISNHCHELKNRDPEFSKKLDILGPIEAPFFRVAKRYRFQMILKCGQSMLLHRFTRKIFFGEKNIKKQTHVSIDIDVDPYFMM